MSSTMDDKYIKLTLVLFRVPDIEWDGENKLGQLIHQSGFSVA